MIKISDSVRRQMAEKREKFIKEFEEKKKKNKNVVELAKEMHITTNQDEH